MIKIDYQNFKKMMNCVGKDFVNKANGKIMYVAYSGGLDSTALLLALRNGGGKIRCVHGKMYKNNEEWWGRRFQEDIARYVCEMLDIPLKILPYTVYENEVNWFYPTFSQLKIDHVFTGEGMEDCFHEMHGKNGELFKPTFGEYIHAKYWLFDLLFKTIPTQIKTYRINTYDERNNQEFYKNVIKNFKILSDKYGTKIIQFSEHPEFKEFFRNYTENVRDIFFPKLSTKLYVKEYLRVSYNRIVLKTMKKYGAKYGLIEKSYLTK
jgi:hypothetical protein